MSEVEHNTPCVDLERYGKTALSKRQLAWELLKQTRNPEYVGIRYGFDVERLRQALEKIPDEQPMFKRLQHNGSPTAGNGRGETFERPGDILPAIESRERIPGEDDDKE